MDIIVDIDGTLADLTHRRHLVESAPKDWAAFYAAIEQDTVIKPVADLVRSLWREGNRIVLCSGREETLRERTQAWLSKALIFYDDLYMRPIKDYRPDDIIKSELLDRIIADGYRPELAFDDRARVVAMWRARGLICAQVSPGEF